MPASCEYLLVGCEDESLVDFAEITDHTRPVTELLPPGEVLCSSHHVVYTTVLL